MAGLFQTNPAFGVAVSRAAKVVLMAVVTAVSVVAQAFDRDYHMRTMGCGSIWGLSSPISPQQPSPQSGTACAGSGPQPLPRRPSVRPDDRGQRRGGSWTGLLVWPLPD